MTHQPLSWQDLQQLDEHASVPQVHVEVGDPAGHSGQVRVHPLCEGLLLHRLTLICTGERQEVRGQRQEVRGQRGQGWRNSTFRVFSVTFYSLSLQTHCSITHLWHTSFIFYFTKIRKRWNQYKQQVFKKCVHLVSFIFILMKNQYFKLRFDHFYTGKCSLDTTTSRTVGK